MLIGHGFDIHRLVEGKELVIGGVNIPYELGADAHSDGDVIYHSVVDAILGERLHDRAGVRHATQDNTPSGELFWVPEQCGRRAWYGVVVC